TVLSDDEVHQCSPTEQGVRCKVSVSKPGVAFLLRETDLLKAVRFVKQENSEYCFPGHKGQLVAGRVIKHALHLNLSDLGPLAFEVFHTPGEGTS
ncbi:hypothetical protein CWC28_22270, partial [Pseudoalteromonas sp. S4492]